MDATTNEATPSKVDEEQLRRTKRAALKELNIGQTGQGASQNALPRRIYSLYPNGIVEMGKALDSSLKRHTALIKRMRQSVGLENRDQILKDVESLSLEKYVDEIVGAVAEGILRCKTEKDIWNAVEVRARSLRKPSSP